MDRESVYRIGSIIDANENGTIDYRDFISANLSSDEYLNEDHMQAAFQYFDIDKDGRISKDDLRKCLGAKNVTKKELNDIMS